MYYLVIEDTKYQATSIALKALTEASLSDQELIYVNEHQSAYVYYANAKSGEYAPNDQTNGTGFWVKDSAVLYSMETSVEAGYTNISANHPGSLDVPVISILSNVNKGDHRDINYKTELMSNVHLYVEETFLATGLIDVCTFYHNYVDANNKGQEVIRIEHVWTVDTSGTAIKTAQNVQSRIKTRKYKKLNGSYHIDENITSKLYITAKQYGDEGERRRENTLRMAQVGVVTALLYTATSPDQEDAEGKLIDIFEELNNAVSTYLKSGRGSLYDDVNNTTTHTWLDVLLGTTVQGILGLPAGWDAKDIREYMVEKLKGEI